MEMLIKNINQMTNQELIGLAKNRFLPEDVQMAVAKTYYRRAHSYLAENTGLGTKVRDWMYSDECNRGYSLKLELMSAGHYQNEPEIFEEVYERYKGSWSRSGWRFAAAFFGNRWYRAQQKFRNPSPASSDLLNRIYDEKYDPKSHVIMNHIHSYSSPRFELDRLSKHENVDLKLAIKLSQCGIKDIEKVGFAKIVELS